jgi:hypothetical protein
MQRMPIGGLVAQVMGAHPCAMTHPASWGLPCGCRAICMVDYGAWLVMRMWSSN